MGHPRNCFDKPSPPPEPPRKIYGQQEVDTLEIDVVLPCGLYTPTPWTVEKPSVSGFYFCKEPTSEETIILKYNAKIKEFYLPGIEEELYIEEFDEGTLWCMAVPPPIPNQDCK